LILLNLIDFVLFSYFYYFDFSNLKNWILLSFIIMNLILFRYKNN
jgi:hypothetical protein